MSFTIHLGKRDLGQKRMQDLIWSVFKSKRGGKGGPPSRHHGNDCSRATKGAPPHRRLPATLNKVGALPAPYLYGPPPTTWCPPRPFLPEGATRTDYMCMPAHLPLQFQSCSRQVRGSVAACAPNRLGSRLDTKLIKKAFRN